MDVHSTNYTLCAMEPVLDGEDRIFANIQVTPDYKNVLQFIENLKNKLGSDDSYSIECGYEAGCLGYSLYNQLTSAGVKCVILAPTTMLTQQGKRVKTAGARKGRRSPEGRGRSRDHPHHRQEPSGRGRVTAKPERKSELSSLPVFSPDTPFIKNVGSR